MIALALAVGLLNGLRGRGLLPRWAFVPLCGIAAGLVAHDGVFGLVTSAGIALWVVRGWGAYFSCVTGRYDPADHEVAWIDRACRRVVPPRPTDTPARNRLRGTLGMSLRGAHLYPLFLGLWAWGSDLAPAVGLGCLLQGPVYWLSGRLVPERHAVAAAEFTFGALIGLLLALGVAP